MKPVLDVVALEFVLRPVLWHSVVDECEEPYGIFVMIETRPGVRWRAVIAQNGLYDGG